MTTPTTLETVLCLLNRGIRPVLMPYGTKAPKTEGWPQIVITRETATTLCNGVRRNVGAILGVGGLADGDMDCTEAVLAASVLMPPTGFIFGRPSRPRSHFFYRLTPAIPSLKFTDPLLAKVKKDEATIVELRCLKKDGSVGFQTVTPWSWHGESGELIRFEQGGDKDPANLDADVLVKAVSRVAAAALLARHFPPAKGGRNEAFMAIAGTLARAGWTVEDAIKFNFAIYSVLWQGTADHSVCASEVKPTFTKYAAGKDIIGATRLKKLIDERVVATALEWLDIAPEGPPHPADVAEGPDVAEAADTGTESDASPEPGAEEQMEAPPEDAGAESDSEALPDIRTNGRELRDVSTDALAALLLANNPPKLFSRAGAPVRVDLTEDGRPIIVTLTDTHVRGEMTRAANFFKLSKKQQDYIRTTVDPPLNVARDLLTRPPQELGLPALESIAESPFITADGIVICQPGYHAGTRTFYAPSGELKDFHVPEKPTDNEVNAARELIEEVFVNFPFKEDDKSSKANLIALFLTPELRQAIRGNVPCALLDAPQMGSGKSLAAEVVALKTTGADALMKPAPTRDEEEWRKLLTATIQDGRPLAVFDNVDAVLDSSNLALALTANTWTDRLLGKTALVTFPVRTIFVTTGNNITLGNDLARRCYWVRLDAQSSTPWLNREFKHPNLRKWVLENRGRLLSAVLTLAKGWFVAGCPEAKTPTLGSFEQWCRVVGGVLQHAGIEGFLGNLDELYQQADPSLVAWEAFLAALKDRMPAEGFKVSQVVDSLRTDDTLRNTLPEDLGDLDPLEKFRRRLGKAFLKRNHRRHGDRGLYLDRGEPKQGSVMWSVREGAK